MKYYFQTDHKVNRNSVCALQGRALPMLRWASKIAANKQPNRRKTKEIAIKLNLLQEKLN